MEEPTRVFPQLLVHIISPLVRHDIDNCAIDLFNLYSRYLDRDLHHGFVCDTDIW